MWAVIALVAVALLLLNKYVIDPFMMDLYREITNTSEWMEDNYESTDKD